MKLTKKEEMMFQYLNAVAGMVVELKNVFVAKHNNKIDEANKFLKTFEIHAKNASRAHECVFKGGDPLTDTTIDDILGDE